MPTMPILVDQTKAAHASNCRLPGRVCRQEQIAAQKAVECKQIHDEVQVKRAKRHCAHELP